MAYTVQSLSGQTKYNLSRRYGAVQYIVVHYTATMASAKNNVIYFSGGNRGASADYFIDDGSIWRFNPDPRRWFSWHCGDGHGRWGITNANSIGIEVVSDGRDFTSAEVDRLAWLVGSLMDSYGVPASHVVRHYDASRKLCPAPYIDSRKWAALKARITEGEIVTSDDIEAIAKRVWNYKPNYGNKTTTANRLYLANKSDNEVRDMLASLAEEVKALRAEVSALK